MHVFTPLMNDSPIVEIRCASGAAVDPDGERGPGGVLGVRVEKVDHAAAALVRIGIAPAMRRTIERKRQIASHGRLILHPDRFSGA
jgi:hypothetical protein